MHHTAPNPLLPSPPLLVLVCLSQIPERRAWRDPAEPDTQRHDPDYSEQVLATSGSLVRHLCPNAVVVRWVMGPGWSGVLEGPGALKGGEGFSCCNRKGQGRCRGVAGREGFEAWAPCGGLATHAWPPCAVPACQRP